MNNKCCTYSIAIMLSLVSWYHRHKQQRYFQHYKPNSTPHALRFSLIVLLKSAADLVIYYKALVNTILLTLHRTVISVADMTNIGMTLTDLPPLITRCVWALLCTVYLSVLQIWYCLYPPEGKSLKDKHVLVSNLYQLYVYIVIDLNVVGKLYARTLLIKYFLKSDLTTLISYKQLNVLFSLSQNCNQAKITFIVIQANV